MLVAPAPVRATRLREVATRALDETLAGGCAADDYVSGFANGVEYRDILQDVQEQSQRSLRTNILVRSEHVYS